MRATHSGYAAATKRLALRGFLLAQGSNDADPGDSIRFEWDFDGNGTVDSTEPAPTYVYSQPGVYQARLTVTDPDGKDGTTVIPVTVGNTAMTAPINSRMPTVIRTKRLFQMLMSHNYDKVDAAC